MNYTDICIDMYRTVCTAELRQGAALLSWFLMQYMDVEVDLCLALTLNCQAE